MNELLRCRAMEGLCRQRAAFLPEEHWKWLAEAEMWNHKAIECSNRPKETKAAATESSSVKEESFLRGRRDRAEDVRQVFGGASPSVKNADWAWAELESSGELDENLTKQKREPPEEAAAAVAGRCEAALVA